MCVRGILGMASLCQWYNSKHKTQTNFGKTHETNVDFFKTSFKCTYNEGKQPNFKLNVSKLV